jgi:hypothetical protein
MNKADLRVDTKILIEGPGGVDFVVEETGEVLKARVPIDSLEENGETLVETREYFLRLGLVREARESLFELLGRLADQTPWSKRSWFRVTEIAEHCGRVEALVPLDRHKCDRTLELLRGAILRGEFERVAHLCESPLARIRFDRKSMTDPDLFRPKDRDLWISRADCEGWFSRNNIPFPKEWKVEIPRSERGRPPEWNWLEINTRLEIHETFSSKDELYKTITKYAKSLPGKKRKPLNRRTIDAAVEKYKWMRLVQK